MNKFDTTSPQRVKAGFSFTFAAHRLLKELGVDVRDLGRKTIFLPEGHENKFSYRRGNPATEGVLYTREEMPW